MNEAEKMIQDVETVVYVPSLESWNGIKDDIVRLESEAFKDKAFSPEELEKDFLNSKNTTVLIKEGDKIIGFTFARSLDEADESGREAEVKETAYIWDTVIDVKYRGRNLVGQMMAMLEEELRRKGYSFIERVASTANNYAENIYKHYKDRIIASEPRETKYGKQVFFRIKL